MFYFFLAKYAIIVLSTSLTSALFAIVVTCVVHEAGHAFYLWKYKVPITAFRFGRGQTWFIFKNIVVLKWFFMGAAVHCEKKMTKKQIMVTSMAGVSFNLICLIPFSYLFYIYYPIVEKLRPVKINSLEYIFMWGMFTLFCIVVFNFLGIISNIFPYVYKGEGTDMLVFRLAQKGENEEANKMITSGAEYYKNILNEHKSGRKTS